MVSTLTVLAASMMLGQSPDAVPQPIGKNYTYSGGVLVPVNDGLPPAVAAQKPPAPEAKHPILDRIKGWFKRDPEDGHRPHTIGGNAKVDGSPAMPAAEFGVPEAIEMPNKALPAGPAPKADAVGTQPTSTAAPKTQVVGSVSLKSTPADATKVVPAEHSPIRPGNADRIGRDEKFEWVTGQLELEKGHFILYYATPQTVDTYHGRIQLNPQKVDMRQFHSGDLISVRGQLRAGATPVYALTSADIIEKAKK
jgi:hypothetical protein